MPNARRQCAELHLRRSPARNATACEAHVKRGTRACARRSGAQTQNVRQGIACGCAPCSKIATASKRGFSACLSRNIDGHASNQAALQSAHTGCNWPSGRTFRAEGCAHELMAASAGNAGGELEVEIDAPLCSADARAVA
eukprot:3196369-Pleurochrysis_carterae.AAC.3